MGYKRLRKPSASFCLPSTGKSDSGGVQARVRRGSYQGFGAFSPTSVGRARDRRSTAMQRLWWRKRGIKLANLRATDERAGSYRVHGLGNPRSRWASKVYPSHTFLFVHHI